MFGRARPIFILARAQALPKTASKVAMPRFLSSYPDHEVVGLPALSPTMEAGTIGAWNVKEGDRFSAGQDLPLLLIQVIAEIETDKATMGFEAQDPGVVAKILIQAGQEVKVGEAIMVIVDSADETGALVTAFANFVVAGAPVAKAAPAPQVKAAAPAAPVAPAVPVAPATSVPAPAPTLAPAPATPRAPAAPIAAIKAEEAPKSATAVPNPATVRWGQLAKSSSLAYKLGKDQQAYIAKYGSTGQSPIV